MKMTIYRSGRILAAFYVAICATAASSGVNVAQDGGNLLAIAERLGKGEPVRNAYAALGMKLGNAGVPRSSGTS